MQQKLLGLGLSVCAIAALSFRQETPRSLADTYNSLADSILAVKLTEENLVRTLLDGHTQAARSFFERGMFDRAAAEMALVANEGDNTIGGVRKRLIDGGQHHNAEGEAQGIFDAGFVIVTKKAKEQGMAASAAMRSAKTDAERKTAWQQFEKLTTDLLKVK